MNRSIPRRIDEMARTNGKGQTTKNKRLHRTTVSGNRLVLNGSSIYDCSLPCFIFFKFVSLMAKDNQTTITKNVFFFLKFGSGHYDVVVRNNNKKLWLKLTIQTIVYDQFENDPFGMDTYSIWRSVHFGQSHNLPIVV